jgi:hypothetical protein
MVNPIFKGYNQWRLLAPFCGAGSKVDLAMPKAGTAETLEPIVAQAKTAVMLREDGRFVKPKSALSKVAPQPVDERLRAERDAKESLEGGDLRAQKKAH